MGRPLRLSRAQHTKRHALCSAILAEAAGLLGMNEDHAHYAALAGAVCHAFQQEFVTPSGRLSSDTQTAYALALTFDLLASDRQRERAGKRLVELVAAEGYRIGTGFVGTPLVLDALSSVGAHDIAYHLLLQRECPSWLYAVTMGATTVWERWDSLLSDGTVNPGEMTSFNHYAFGSVADWVHRTLVGLAPGAPGYRRILVKPQPGGGIVHAEAEHLTPYGRVAVEWARTGGTLKVVVTVPPNATASVQLPGATVPAREVGSGTHTFVGALRDPADDPAMPKPDLVDIHTELDS
jgi:alpha-L-rhamnosidase